MQLDPEICSQLRRVGGDELVGQLFRTFVELGPQRLAAVRDGIASGDALATRKAVHSIRSSAATLGATLLSEEAGRLERLTQETSLVDVGQALPLLEQALAAAIAEMERHLREPLSGGGAMKKVAVVEDNADIRLLVRAILEDRYEVVEYASGPDALAGLPTARPDLVLLDISLPGMDGTQVLESLRQHPRLAEVPVVALTAHAMTGDRERFLDTGFDHYLAKPILDVDEFVAVIDGALAARSASR